MAYSHAMRVVQAALAGTVPYSIWGLSAIFSFNATRQTMHDDWTVPQLGGVSLIVTLDEGGALWVGSEKTQSDGAWRVDMSSCGDCAVFGAGTLHGGSEYSKDRFPLGHWRLFCYGVPSWVLLCTGDAMAQPGLCKLLL